VTSSRFRTLAGALVLLPAIEIGSRSPFLPTFIPGCEATPPRVTSVYTGEGLPVPRARDAAVGVFLHGDAPRMRYVVVGEVRVTTSSRVTSLNNLIECAQREARRLGGDAIVDVWPGPATGDLAGQRTLTARVVNWR
jgi:hypothetical protein